MENNSQVYVVGIRFSKIGKLYNFDASNFTQVKLGDQVVVETSRGWQLGEVVQIIGNMPTRPDSAWKMINRMATPEDITQRKLLEIREEELVSLAKKVVHDQNLEGVKIVSVEYSLDGSRFTLLYSYEGETKIDLRALKYEINRAARNAQVELRQIGPRDVAKIFGGMGACGLPTRCCSKFLTDFSSISIRMAKEQGISLTPAEITGMCGRLRCCLIYEYEMYAENRKMLPKRNKFVMTPVGVGKVVDLLPLKLAVVVELPQLGRREFNNADVQVVDGMPQVEMPARGLERDEPEFSPPAAAPATQDRGPAPKGESRAEPAEGKPGFDKSKRDSNAFRNRRPRRGKRKPGGQEGNSGRQNSGNQQ